MNHSAISLRCLHFYAITISISSITHNYVGM